MLTKENIYHSIDSLPDNLTLEQVIEEMILLDKIDQGIIDMNNGSVFSTEQIKEKLDKWLK